MRRSPALELLVVALAIASGGVAAGELQGVQLVQAGAGTRAELRIEGAPAYHSFRLANPDRLVVDLPDTRLAPGLRLPGANGAVSGLRTGQPVPGTLRVVFDLGLPAASRTRLERTGNDSLLVIELGDTRVRAEVADPAEDVALAAGTAREPARIESLVPDAASTTPPASIAPSAPVAVAPVAVAPKPTPVPVAPARTEAPPTRPAKTVQDVIGRGQRELVVAIDAGHGGKDPGALGPTGVREKQVTLAVARELARQIDADPGMRAVLIREGDSFVSLKQRYMKARAAQADLFISIHADAALNDSASGASVYVLSTRGASSQAARWLADKENAADLVGGVSLDSRDGNLAAVLLDLSQSATMRASDDVASQVLGELKRVGKAHKPSIERANFVVLRSPDVPSLLVETGFITNPGEERKLNDPAHRARLAAAIAEGVRRYFVGQPPPGSWFARRAEAGGPASASLAAAPE